MKWIVAKIEKLLARIAGVKVIFDRERQLGNFQSCEVQYETNLCKEDIARRYIFEVPGKGLNFLDVGARDGKLEYLLGITENLNFDEQEYKKNAARFGEKYRYYGMDVVLGNAQAVICGDICSDEFLRGNSE